MDPIHILYVSILILLDYLFLLEELEFYADFYELRFNPYFTGLPILIVLSSPIEASNDKVSILILLDYLFL